MRPKTPLTPFSPQRHSFDDWNALARTGNGFMKRESTNSFFKRVTSVEACGPAGPALQASQSRVSPRCKTRRGVRRFRRYQHHSWSACMENANSHEGAAENAKRTVV
jgi:hypothetical protein